MSHYYCQLLYKLRHDVNGQWIRENLAKGAAEQLGHEQQKHYLNAAGQLDAKSKWKMHPRSAGQEHTHSSQYEPNAGELALPEAPGRAHAHMLVSDMGHPANMSRCLTPQMAELLLWGANGLHFAHLKVEVEMIGELDPSQDEGEEEWPAAFQRAQQDPSTVRSWWPQ
jgi:hypothetical protein